MTVNTAELPLSLNISTTTRCPLRLQCVSSSAVPTLCPKPRVWPYAFLRFLLGCVCVCVCLPAWVYLYVLPVYMSVHHVHAVPMKVRRGRQIPLVVNCHASAGYQTQIFCKSSQCS
jgi:hypothetical protein